MADFFRVSMSNSVNSFNDKKTDVAIWIATPVLSAYYKQN